MLINKAWLLSHFPYQKISAMSTLLKVEGIGASKHKSAQFIALSLYFPGEDQAKQRGYAAIKYKLHLIYDL